MRTLLRYVVNSAPVEYLPGRVKSFARALANTPVFPTMLNIEPTRRCNLRCVMCHLGQPERVTGPDMSLDMFRRIVCLFPNDLKRVTIQGLGEPLLNKSLLDMIEFCRKRNLETRFNTNMTIMNDAIAERLVRCGHSEVQVSLETTDPDLYADIRRGATIERVMHNLALLVETKKRLKSALPRINVHAVLMKAILPTIPAMVSTLKEAGVHHLLFSDLGVIGDTRLNDGTSMAENSLSSTMSEEEIASVLKGIKSLETQDFRIDVPGEWLGFRTAPRSGGIMTCRELWEEPYVTCEGNATPCCVVPEPSAFDLGNYSEMGFGGIWFGDRYQQLRLSHILNRHPAPCRNCARLVCTFAEPSRLKARVEVQDRYTKGFIGHRFVARRILGMKPKPPEKDVRVAEVESSRTQRVIESKEGHLAGPWELIVFPTNRCNLRCNICWQRWAIEKFGEVGTEIEVSDERWLRLIDEGASLGVREWTIVGGGEPLIRRDLVLNMAKKIKHLGMACTVHTNGTLLKTESIERLVDMGLDTIVFSLDAADQETNDDIRSQGSFERATAAIRNVVEMKRKRNTGSPEIRIAGVLTSTNYTKVVEFVEFFHGLGCGAATLATLAEQGSSCKRFALTPEQESVAIANIRTAMTRAHALGIFTNFETLLRRLEGELTKDSVVAQTCTPLAEGMCFEPWLAMVIQPGGITGPCCVSYDEEAPSIATMSLADIWTGPYFQTLRERAAKNQSLPYCELCPMHLIERTRCMKTEIAEATGNNPK